ncbi:MAG: 1-acyl-sn-glycerol-3-phosphate acyltransferase [Clostridia bacterium]|nr:1-acyl-sn-glycerol-3-phosphate acyltransferase [Clostridia bacterium]
MTISLLAVASAIITALLYIFTNVSWWFLLPIFLGLMVGILLLVLTPCLLYVSQIDMEKPVEKSSKFINFYSALMLDVALTFMRIKLVYTGEEKLPNEPFLFVGNHRSNYDPLVGIFALRKHRVGFVAKKELFKIPIIGRMMHLIFCLSLNRGTIRDEVKTIGRAIEVIDSGEASIGIYPEGTRNSGEGLLPFKNGAFKIAKKADCSVAVGVIRGSEECRKNFPKKTVVMLDIVGVLDREYVSAHSTAEISDKARDMMEEFITTHKA